MSKLTVAVGVLALLAGLLIGNARGISKGKAEGALAGRVSACNEIMSVLNRGMGFDLECKVKAGEVFLFGAQGTQGHLVTLDGKLAD
jgi:outer membrane lipoprotein SlyB